MAQNRKWDILTPEEYLAGKLFHIGDCYSEHGSSFNNRLHFHNFYEMSIIYEGSSDFMVNGEVLYMKERSIQLIRPSDYHCQLTKPSEHIRYYNLIFSPELVSEELLQELAQSTGALCVDTELEDWADLRRLVQKMLCAFEQPEDRALGQLFIRCNVENLCIYLLSRCRDRPPSLVKAYREPVQRAILYVQRNYRFPIKLSDAAADAGLSPTYFSMVFHTAVGVSFSQYLSDCRLQAAERYLRSSELPVKAISSICGFASYSYFISAFRKRFGCPPAMWRRRCAGNDSGLL